MKLFPPLFNYSKKQISNLIAAILASILIYILHFTLEIYVITRLDLPIFLVIFHYLGIPVGCFLTIKIFSRFNHYIGFIGSFTLMISIFISLLIIRQAWFVPIGLFVAGIGVGIMFPYIWVFTSFALSEPKFNCRFVSMSLTLSSIFMLIDLFMWNLQISQLHITFYILVLIVFSIALIYSKGSYKLPLQNKFQFRQYIKNKNRLAELLSSFFWGFFFVISYYSIYVFLDLYGLLDLYLTFQIFFMISYAIFSFPCGVIADIIGRRFTLLIGFLIQALAFLLLSILINIDLSLFFIIPLILGPGFSLIINPGIMIGVELASPDRARDNTAIYVGVMGIGCTAGAGLSKLSRPLITIDPAYLTLVLLFIFVIASVVVFKLRETLPPKSELYIRPEKLSKEDLTLFRERKICIVCKGDVSRFDTYICPDCGALYCTKCAKALSDLENLCWVCDTSFDESKPVRRKDKTIKKSKDKDLTSEKMKPKEFPK